MLVFVSSRNNSPAIWGAVPLPPAGTRESAGRAIADDDRRLVAAFLERWRPKVDAVTSATMSSGLIFDTIRRLGDTYREMKKKGLI